MKARRTTVLLVVALGVMLGRDAQAFYNPSTGRWLNRDPIGERGGMNASAFAENRPTMQADVDGRMILREFPSEFPQRPRKGPYVTYDGLTWFNAFEPKARAYKGLEGPCCWKIIVPGYADLYYWWVRNARGPGGVGTARDHELEHVAIHRDTFHGFNCEASGYTGICFSKAKADCFRDVINREMKKASLDYNHVQNLELDCRALGSRCDEIPQAKQDAVTARNQVTSALQRCEPLE